MKLDETGPPPVSKEARRALRRRLLGILRKPGARERIRWGQGPRLLLLPVAMLVGAHSLALLKAFLLWKLIPLGPLVPDAWSREVLLAMKKASLLKDRDPDWSRAFQLLDQADGIRPTPYSSFLRAGFLFQSLAEKRGEKVRRLREAAAAGARLEPENVLWPLLEAQARALGGHSREALRHLLEELPRRPAFRWPLPDGPERDLLLLVEGTSLPELLTLFAERIGILTAEAVMDAQEGDAGAARELAGVLDRVAKASVEDRRRDESIGRMGLLLSAGSALRERAVLVAAAPRAFEPGEGGLAAQRAALIMSAQWRVEDVRMLILLHLSAVVVMMACTSFYLRCRDFTGWIRGRGQEAIAWIQLGAGWTVLLRPMFAGAVLGASWFLVLKSTWVTWVALATLAVAVIIGIILDSCRGGRGASAGRGPWSLQIGKESLFVGWPTWEALVASAGLAICAGLLLLPPRGIEAPWRLLLSPPRILAVAHSVPGDATAARSGALLDAAFDRDPARVERACRETGIAIPARLPEGRMAALREHLEALRAARVPDADGGEPPRKR